MGIGLPLTDEEKGKIQVYSEKGDSVNAISKQLGRSRGVITSYLRNPETYGTKKPTGRPSKLSNRDIRAIRKLAGTKSMTAHDILLHLKLNVDVRTVQRTLKSSPVLVWTKRISKPCLLPHHKIARELWATQMVDFGDNWDNVIFSDEKKFNLDGPDGMQYYWHDIRKENETCFSRQQGGGSIMVWGAFSAKGTSQLAILDGRQTAEMYVDTLSEYMLPFAHQNYGLDYIFQQDNASIHTASVTREFFCDMNIEVMSWPALSPDLNPIENLWGLLVRKVYACGRQFLTENYLKSQILKSWSEIGQNEIKPLIKSMKMRCIEVIKSKGGNTKY